MKEWKWSSFPKSKTVTKSNFYTKGEVGLLNVSPVVGEICPTSPFFFSLMKFTISWVLAFVLSNTSALGSNLACMCLGRCKTTTLRKRGIVLFICSYRHIHNPVKHPRWIFFLAKRSILEAWLGSKSKNFSKSANPYFKLDYVNAIFKPSSYSNFSVNHSETHHFFVTSIWDGKPVDSSSHRLSPLYYKRTD